MGDFTRVDSEYPRFSVDGIDPQFLSWLQDNLENIKLESNARQITYAVNTADVATIANTSETTLYSLPLPASYFIANDICIRLKGFGITAANANTKRLRGYLGASLIFDTGTFSGSGKHWTFDLKVCPTGSAAQNAFGLAIINGQNPVANFVGLTQDMTVASTLSITGTNGTASANDIVLKSIQAEISKA